MSKQVLVFPESVLDRLGRFEGLLMGQRADAYLGEILKEENIRFVERESAEQDPSVKQLIPYVVLADRQGRVFAYQRTKKGGESRLHDLWSVGVGGHIEPQDVPDDLVTVMAYEAGFYRELAEETGLLFKKDICRLSVIGLLYDPSNLVGQVHFGVVHWVVLPGDSQPRFNDPALANGSFRPFGELVRDVDSFENWSKLVIQKLHY